MIRATVSAEVSVSERVQVLMEPERGVIWLRATVPPHSRRREGEVEEAILEAMYDARWALSEWAREAGLIPLKQSLGYRQGFPYFFNGELAAIGFESDPAQCGERQEIVHRET